MVANEPSNAVSQAPSAPKKFFTVDEANRALPYISRVVDDITKHYEHAVELHRRIIQPDLTDPGNKLQTEYETEMSRINELIDELTEVGVELKDLDKGLIDFPAKHQGRTVCLCWKRGEKELVAWHETDTGFAGRQDINTLDPTEDTEGHA